MKNYDSVIEAIPWIRPFIDVKTMNIHQKMLTFFEKKNESILQGGDVITRNLWEN